MQNQFKEFQNRIQANANANADQFERRLLALEEHIDRENGENGRWTYMAAWEADINQRLRTLEERLVS